MAPKESMSSGFSQQGLPAAIQVPAGNKVAMETVGIGEITYECRDKANAPGQTEWVFVGPNAVLNDRSGKTGGILLWPSGHLGSDGWLEIDRYPGGGGALRCG